MKTNKYIMVDLLLLGLTIALMIFFDVDFYPADSNSSITREVYLKDDNLNQTYKNIDKQHIQTDILMNEVLANMEKRDFYAALVLCNKILTTDSTFVKGYYLRAQINTLLDRKTEAMKDYNKCLHFNPDLYLVYLNRGLLNLKVNKSINAIFDITNAVKINPVKSISFLFSQSVKSVF